MKAGKKHNGQSIFVIVSSRKIENFSKLNSRVIGQNKIIFKKPIKAIY